jgi:hypothetical protein
MKAPLGRLGHVLLAFIGKFPAEEVAANLRRLKEVIETAKITDTSYSKEPSLPRFGNASS